MSWAKLDDSFHDNPQILALDHHAFRLYVCAITYSSKHGTDGYISQAAALSICRLERVRPAAIEGLVRAGRWEAESDGDGYHIHHFLDYNPTAAEAKSNRSALSEIRAAAGRKGGQATQANRVANLKQPPEAKIKPRPVPSRPVPDESLVLLSEHIAEPGLGGTPAQRIFDAWKLATGRTGRTVFSPKLRKLVAAALKVYGEQDLLDAVRGWQHDPWEERPQHTELDVLLRHVEKFRDLERNGPPVIMPKQKPTLSDFYRQEAERHRLDEAASPNNGALLDEAAALDIAAVDDEVLP